MVLEQINIVKQAAMLLYKNGMSLAFLPIGMSQLAHETAGFTSRVSVDNNNLSGIKYINKPYQKNATQGIASPEGNHYAHFKTLDDWAIDYMRILNMGTLKPINANTIDDFAYRLKENGYYTDTLQNYTAALNSWYYTIAGVIADIDFTSVKKKL